MGRFQTFAFIGGLLLSNIALAQSTTRAGAPLTGADKINTYVDMLSRLKAAMQQVHSNDPAAAYRVVSLRVMNCAVWYKMFLNDPKNDAAARAGLAAASEIYAKVAGSLYPGSSDEFKKDLANLKDDFLRAKKDEKSAFYFVRNCKDLSDQNPQNVYSAVTEITLQSSP